MRVYASWMEAGAGTVSVMFLGYNGTSVVEIGEEVKGLGGVDAELESESSTQKVARSRYNSSKFDSIYHASMASRSRT